MKHYNNKLLTIISTIVVLSSFNSNIYADNKTSTYTTTATLNASCRVKVNNMSFGDVSIQAMSGSGDVYATSQLSLLCTKNQSVTLTSNSGVNGSGGSWVLGTNYVCQTNYNGYWANDGDQTSCARELFNRNGGKINSYDTYLWTAGGTPYTLKFTKPDGSNIERGESAPAASANMISGSNKIAYSLSTNNSTYAPINGTASNALTYNKNDGDWQDYPLYGKANVKQAAPGIYLDTNTITVNF